MKRWTWGSSGSRPRVPRTRTGCSRKVFSWCSRRACSPLFRSKRRASSPATPEGPDLVFTFSQPSLHVAIRRGGVVLVDDLLVLRVTLVVFSLLERRPRFAEQFRRGDVVLGAQRGERLHHVSGGGGEFELVAVVQEDVDPIFAATVVLNAWRELPGL